MDPTRDLRAIADLVGEAFADELDDRGRAALREMRWMAWLTPLVWWWAQADPSFQDSFNGFVWEEPAPRGKGRRVIGNASLNRAPGDRLRWIICNVVVQDGYRGQGIGRRLTEAAIAEARDLGAVGVVLQVYQDNLPALQLYTDLGFHKVAGEATLRLGEAKSVAFWDTSSYRFRPWRPADGQAALDLARLVTPPAQQWLRPVRAHKYQIDWWARLGQWFADLAAGRKVYRLVALRDDRLVAMMTTVAAFRRGDHHLALLVHPDHAGQVEAVLISRALHMLAGIPPRPVRATVDSGHEAILKTLQDYGFEEQRTLLTLSKELGRR
jgi:ribosomal protein S18 acetylase RimI-like enzyme